MQVYHTDDSFVIKLEGLEKLWAVRRRPIVIPKELIARIYWDAVYKPPLLAWRELASTSSYFLLAGTWQVNGDREFWYMKHPENLIRSRPSHIMSIDILDRREFDHVRITLDEATAQTFIDWSESLAAKVEASSSSLLRLGRSIYRPRQPFA